MRLLVFHNILFAQYKSIYFENINNDITKNNGAFLVIQTSYSERSRINHFNKESLINSINYPFKLISKKPLEEVSSILIFFNWLYYVIKFKPSIINFTGYNSFLIFLFLIFCKLFGIKTIITNESVIKNLPTDKNINLKFKKYIKKYILSLADYFYTFGINANNLLFDLDIEKQKILTFGNTFDKSKFIKVDEVNLKKSTKINLLFIGRLIEEKNLFNTLTLLAKVNDIVPIKFDIYGDGPQENALQNFVKKNKIDFVEFKSKIKWEDISKIYPNYSHLILLSSSETWGMVANEAQFFNLNVICSSNCGCANDLIINNYNGLVINQMDNQLTPNSIANYLLKQKESSIFTKNNNLIFDESYTIRKFIKKLYLVNELK